MGLQIDSKKLKPEAQYQTQSKPQSQLAQKATEKVDVQTETQTPTQAQQSPMIQAFKSFVISLIMLDVICQVICFIPKANENCIFCQGMVFM